MKKTLLLFLLALLTAPLWGQKASDYRAAAERGDKVAQYNLGICYDNGMGVAQDDKQAVYWWTKAANQGNAKAQSQLGFCYYNGKGVAQDYKQAVYWWTKAANQGDAVAQTSLGGCYYFGLGVEEDCGAVRYWALQAEKKRDESDGDMLDLMLALTKDCTPQKPADPTSTTAPRTTTPTTTSTTQSTSTTTTSVAKPQVSAAELLTQAENYRYGRNGVTKNLSKAVELYRQAANMGDAEAQHELGGCYHQGNGVEKDYEQAVYWYTQSANQGYARGQYMLGVCYYYGVGVRKDYKQAVKWFNAAKAKKNELSDYVQSSIETYLVEAEKHINEQEGTPQKNTTMVSTTSSSKYGRWPWYYDGVDYGVHFAYIQRAIYARDAVSGETGYADVFGEEGWSKGFQVGMHFNPMGKKEIIGMNSGFYMEMLFDKWKNAPSGYYDNYYEFNLHVPLEMVLYLPLGWESALHLRAGLGADFSCSAKVTDWDDSYMPSQEVDYGEGFINRFNLSLNLGLSLHLDGVMFHATYQKGLLGHPFSQGYRCTLDKLSLGLSFVVDD